MPVKNARYWDMEIVPYSKLQEIRPMMDNTFQSMHEMIEAMDEQSEEEANQMRQALLMLDLSDSLRTLRPDTRQKKRCYQNPQ